MLTIGDAQQVLEVGPLSGSRRPRESESSHWHGSPRPRAVQSMGAKQVNLLSGGHFVTVEFKYFVEFIFVESNQLLGRSVCGMIPAASAWLRKEPT